MLRSSSHLLAGVPCLQLPFCLVDIAGFQLELRPTIFMVHGNHPCLPPADLALSENPRRAVGGSAETAKESCVADVGKTGTALPDSADKRKVKAKEVGRKRVHET